jgi:LysM repeat protein
MLGTLLLSFLLAAVPVRDSTAALRYEVANLQAELLQARERIESQELVIDALRKEMENHLTTNKELVKGSITLSENKVSTVEKATKDLALDLIKLKEGTQSSLKELDTHLAKLEKEMDLQGKNIRHFESALKAILDAVGGDKGEMVAIASDKTYIVKDGDSLGKIAVANNTSVKTLKELNNLTKDSIRVGQKLYLP